MRLTEFVVFECFKNINFSLGCNYKFMLSFHSKASYGLQYFA